jgi:hypothetical protein
MRLHSSSQSRWRKSVCRLPQRTIQLAEVTAEQAPSGSQAAGKPLAAAPLPAQPGPGAGHSAAASNASEQWVCGDRITGVAAEVPVGLRISGHFELAKISWEVRARYRDGRYSWETAQRQGVGPHASPPYDPESDSHISEIDAIPCHKRELILPARVSATRNETCIGNPDRTSERSGPQPIYGTASSDVPAPRSELLRLAWDDWASRVRGINPVIAASGHRKGAYDDCSEDLPDQGRTCTVGAYLCSSSSGPMSRRSQVR